MPKVSDTGMGGAPVVPETVVPNIPQEPQSLAPESTEPFRLPAQESPTMRAAAVSMVQSEETAQQKRIKELRGSLLTPEPEAAPAPAKESGFFDFVLNRSELTDQEKGEARERFKGTKDTLIQMGGGVLDVVNEAGNAVMDFTNFLEKHARDLQPGDEGDIPDNTNRKWLYDYLPENVPVTDSEKTARIGAKMLATFLPSVAVASTISKGGAIGTLVTGSAIDAVVDFALFDPKEERLANIIQKFPELQNPITEYLASDADDSAIEGRLKNVLEGQFANAVVAGGFLLVAKAYKRVRMGKLVAREVELVGDASTEAAVSSTKAAEGAAPEAVKAAEGAAPEAVKLTKGEEVLARVKQKLDDGSMSRPEAERLLKVIKEEKAANPKLFDADRYDSTALKNANTVEEVGNAIGISIHGNMTDDDILKLVDDLAKNPDIAKFDPQIIGEIPNPETFAAGIAIASKNPKSILNMKPGDVFNSRQQAAAIILEKTAFKQIDDLAKLVSEGSIKAKADFPTALKNWFRIANLNETAGSEAGRAFQVRKYGNKLKSLDDKQLARHLEEVMKLQGGDADASMEAVLTILSNGDKIKASNMLKEAFKEARITERPMSRILREIQINGMLSSPTTHAGIIVSNAVMTGNDIIERAIARGFTKGNSGIVDGELRAFMRGGSSETVVQIKALWSGVLDSIKNTAKQSAGGDFGGLLKSWNDFGKSKSKIGSELTLFKHTRFEHTPSIGGNAVMDALGTFIRLPTKAIQTGDDVVKAARYRAEVHALAWRDTVEKGLTGAEAQKHYAKLSDSPTAFLKTKYARIHKEGVNAANQLTFSKGAPTLFEGMEEIINTTGLDTFGTPVLKWFFPFSGVEFRIGNYMLERTPLTLISQNYKSAIKEGGARAAMAKAKVAYGTTLMGVGAALGYSGLMTGEGPRNSGAQKLNKEMGIIPHSFKIGENSYSLKGADSVVKFMSLGADLAHLMSYVSDDESLYQDGWDLTMAVAMTAGDLVSPEMFVQESGKFIDVLEGRSDAKEYLSRASGTLIPYSNLGRSLTRQADPTIRETRADAGNALPVLERMINEFKARIPGFSDTLPPVTNIFAEPVMPLQGLGPNSISPLYMASPTKNKVIVEEFMRLGVSGPLVKPNPIPGESFLTVDMPPKSITLVKGTANLDPKQYHRFVELSAGVDLDTQPLGGTLKEVLTDMIQDDYPGLPFETDEAKRVMIKQVINAYRTAAKMQLIEEFPELNISLQGTRMNKYNSTVGDDIISPGDFGEEYGE